LWVERLKKLYNNEDDENNVFIINGIDCFSIDRDIMYTDPELYMTMCFDFLAENADKSADSGRFVPLCVHNDIFGVHYIDSIFGCDVYFEHGQWYNKPLPGNIGSLSLPDIDISEAWLLTKRFTDAFVNAGVKLPVYGLPTIASALVVAVNLYGENILAAMLDEPEAASHDLKVINDTLKELHKRFQTMLPSNQLQPVIPSQRMQPPGFGQLCGCTSQLVSPGCYERFIAPLDEELLGVYPSGGMMHLCGAHEHHIITFRAMKKLRAVQLNDRAAEGLYEYFIGLREDQIIYLNPCKKMPVEKAIEITGGKRLVIIGDYINIKKQRNR